MSVTVKEALYAASTTPYERKLIAVIRQLHELGVKSGVLECVWEDFYAWSRQHVAEATALASAFIVDFMNAKADQPSVAQQVDICVIAFKQWRIGVDEETRREIKSRRNLIWSQKNQQRHAVLSRKKIDQVQALESELNNVVRFCLTTTASNFKSNLVQIDNSARGKYASLSEATRKEVHTLSRKPSSELALVLSAALAYMSMMVATGMRPTNGCAITRNDLVWYNDPPRILIERTEAKTGSKRHATKQVFCCLVPNKQIELCALTHFSRYMAMVASEPTCQEYIFGYGFVLRPNQSQTSYLTMINRRMTAVLEALFIIQNLVGLGDAKKIHIFRSITNKRLASAGCTSRDIEAHVGWTGTVMLNHYSDPKERALNAEMPYKLAGRFSKDDSEHAAWRFIGEINEELPWWRRVAVIASAAGISIPGVAAEPHIKARIDSYVARMARGDIRENESAVERQQRKRIRDLELLLLETKRQKVVEEKDSTDSESTTSMETDPMNTLVSMINDMGQYVKEDGFPTRCRESLKRIIALVHTLSTKKLTFGMKLSGATGKSLQSILLIGGSMHLNNGAFDNCGRVKAQSWYSFISKIKDTHAVVKRISTKSFDDFRNSIKMVE